MPARRKCKADYESSNGFSTKIWGPAAWLFLDMISYNYPVQPTMVQRAGYKQFLESLQHVLPCGQCRKNLVHNLRETNYSDLVYKDRHSFSKFIYNLKQCVYRATTGELALPRSFYQQREQYECFRATCGSTSGVETGCVQTKTPSRLLMSIVPTSVVIPHPSLRIAPECQRR